MKISVAGSGNLGSYITLLLKNKGCTIHQVYSRSIENAKKLAEQVDAQAINDERYFDANVEVVIVALPDRVIPDFIQRLERGNFVVLSTAGSVALSELSGSHEHYGVLYPLQSFTRYTHPDARSIPVCIEAVDEKSTAVALEIAGIISNDVREIDSDKRLILHAAAVFASNFTNHLLSLSEQVVQTSGFELEVLYPLINETINRLKTHSAKEMQTGPAIRNDVNTIEKHLKLLTSIDNPYLTQIYSLLSKSIRDFSPKP